MWTFPRPSLHLPSITPEQRAPPPVCFHSCWSGRGTERDVSVPPPRTQPDTPNRRQTSRLLFIHCRAAHCADQPEETALPSGLKEHLTWEYFKHFIHPFFRLTMVLCEDTDCSVCLSPFSRVDRIPRVLHCRHTFCDPCLETMSQVRSGLLTVGCPLCRRVTCIRRGLSLQEALWVNSRLWDQIAEEENVEDQEEEEERLKLEAEQQSMEAKQQPSLQAECLSVRPSRTKLKFPAFFRKFSLTKQQQERIVPGSNVEMKSWRRLSVEDTF